MNKPVSRIQDNSHLPGIVIPVYNDSEVLQQNLPHFKKYFKEIIIVDNHSQDECEQICQQFGIERLTPPDGIQWTRGQCLNQGASQICSSFVLFLHTDITISEQAIHQLSHCLQDLAYDYSCFRIQFFEKNLSFKLLNYVSNFRSQYLKIIYGDQGLCVRKTVFEEIGGFPDEYMLEDLKINRYLKPYRFQFIDTPIIPSSRKFHQLGFYRYLFLINKVLILNILGVSTKKIHQIYYSSPN